MRETGPPDSILPLEELDRWDLAQKARSWDREGYEQHSEGLGLFLFYGDDFDHAHQLLSRAGREDHEFAERRERRKKWIADRQGVTKDVVERQTEKARQYIADEDFRRAEFLVKNLRSDYKGSDALQAVETELATIERAIRDDRRERELRDALPVALRRDVSLELGPTGEGSETLELTLDFADPERFSDGLGPSWTKSSRGLSRTGFNGDHPERELRSALTLELPVFQEDASAVIDLDFEIPAEGRPADVLDLTAFGTRFLLVQPPGTSDRRGRLLVDPRKKDLGSLLKRSLKQNGGNSWFLLRGGQYVLRLHFAQTRLGKRNVEMELNNGVVWSKPVNGRAAARPETIVLAVVGGLVLRRIRIEGAARP
ncbi:MAG: hypothetical protein ACE5F1_16175 [Planctomycetota bacterium]